jgi:hypothetical protein
MAFSSTGLVGANTDRRTPHQEYKLGTPLIGDDNNTYVYVRASAAIAGATATSVTGAFAASAGAGNYTTGAAFAANEYGWVRKTASPL